MRSLNIYDRIYCDIDGTLIYGWFPSLMDISWKMFHSKQIAKLLMLIQSRFKLYKINEVLRYMLINTETPVVFLTARCQSDSTLNILANEVGRYCKSCKVVELETDNPEVDKMIYIAKSLDKYPKCCLFDDNKDTLTEVGTLDVDTFNATCMYERGVR